MAIPYYLIKKGMFGALSVYFPNLDMLATAIQYGGKNELFGGIWNRLYDSSDTDIMTSVSTIIINYLSLLGLTFVVIYAAVKSNDFKTGWARAFFMILLTYLVPFYIIRYVQNYLGEKISDNDYFLVFVGLLTVFMIIVVELFLINIFIKHVIRYIDNGFKFFDIRI